MMACISSYLERVGRMFFLSLIFAMMLLFLFGFGFCSSLMEGLIFECDKCIIAIEYTKVSPH